jgi:hypothetical protein
MGLKKTLKGLSRAIPVVLVNAPAIVEVVRQVRDALKKPAPAGEPGQAAANVAAPASTAAPGAPAR